jgi:NADH dehydrogenase (ubiquinone) 1 beta subcomplex subunit 10
MAYDESKAAELQGPVTTLTSFVFNLNILTPGYTARVNEREQLIRESWIRTMEARLVREELDKCVRHEGVNHYENCRDLSQRYIQMLRDNRVRLLVSELC